MYWIDSKVKFLLFLCGFALFFSCETPNPNKEKKEDKESNMDSLTDEELIIRQVETNLDIPATENYDIEIMYDFLNPDTLKDAIILVNRREYAYKSARSKGKESFFNEIGNTALANHVFVKLGGSNNLLSTTPIGSNVNYPLEIQFIELTSSAYTDFYIDYRIRNSLQRNYYTVRNNRIYLTFSCPVFDRIGEEEPVVYSIKHKTSSVRLAKDIAMYYGEIPGYNPREIENINYYQPDSIVGTDKLYVYFIFDDKSMKYKTPMRPEEAEE